MLVHFRESRVLELWRDCPGRSDLRTQESGPLKVLYPGRANDDGGADFRDAVIATAYGLQTGDIEVHTKSSLWWAHRHHLDPLYNRVVLHVVFYRDTASPVRLQNGREVPTLALEKLNAPETLKCHPVASPVPCLGTGQQFGDDFFFKVLDAEGENRFRSRMSGFQAAASREEAGQALYTGMMTALGYSRNQFAMAELACRMPLRQLETAARLAKNKSDYRSVCQAMLLGTAGLLPHHNDRLKKLWSGCGDTAAMSGDEWRFSRLRPGNHPALRITAMAGLLSRYRERGLLLGLMEKFGCAPAADGPRFLENALIIHGKEDGSRYEFALLGRQRAADIIINAWLPFASAWGRAGGRADMADKALQIYRRYPAVSSNTLERHMCRQFGIARETVKTAKRQQGLLQLFKCFCAVGNCAGCPVYRALKGKPRSR